MPPPPSRILKVVPGSASTVFATNDGTNGLAILPDGDLVGAIHIDGSICRIPLASPNSPVHIAYQYMSARFNSPNDLAVRSDGNIYFSDPDNNQAPIPRPQGAGHTRVYRISPLPAAIVTVVDETLSEPNGVTLSLDENTLYVSGPGLYKYAVNADGSTGRAARRAQPADVFGLRRHGVRLRGRSLHRQQFERHRLNPDHREQGRRHHVTGNGVQAVSNVAFGGADHKTLFITTLGQRRGSSRSPCRYPECRTRARDGLRRRSCLSASARRASENSHENSAFLGWGHAPPCSVAGLFLSHFFASFLLPCLRKNS